MGLFDISNSSTKSIQDAKLYTAQQFSGSCNVKCENKMDNIDIVISHTDVEGGVNFNQSCQSSGNCMISSGIDALSTINFKAANTSNAKHSSGGLFDLFDYHNSSSTATQDIKNSIIQASDEKCEVVTENDIDDTSLFAEYSKIKGGINFSQTGSVNAKCSLDNIMSATASAIGNITNDATAG